MIHLCLNTYFIVGFFLLAICRMLPKLSSSTTMQYAYKTFNTILIIKDTKTSLFDTPVFHKQSILFLIRRGFIHDNKLATFKMNMTDIK